VLSTVSTESIERIANITEGKAWFQLYNPIDDTIRDDLIRRCEIAGIKTFVILVDVPKVGYRNTEIKNGLTIPPKMTMKNIMQIISRPHWATQTLIHGQPEFKTIKKYMPKDLDMSQIGEFMQNTFDAQVIVTSHATKIRSTIKCVNHAKSYKVFTKFINSCCKFKFWHF